MIGKDAAARQDWAAMTQAEYERGQGLYRDERERLRQLPDWPRPRSRRATMPRPTPTPRKCCPRPTPRHNGSAIFYGNQVLGRLALAEGDVRGRTRLLLASAETTGSPSLCNFGPSMVLASDLLDRGERDVVLRYLERCSSFWKHGAEELSQWAAAIERGVTPDFGPFGTETGSRLVFSGGGQKGQASMRGALSGKAQTHTDKDIHPLKADNVRDPTGLTSGNAFLDERPDMERLHPGG